MGSTRASGTASAVFATTWFAGAGFLVLHATANSAVVTVAISIQLCLLMPTV
jgi:hypothetical protein